MNNYKKKQLTGFVYLIAGGLLLIWASHIVFQVLIFFVGLMLINTGMQLRGYGSLWAHATRFFMQIHF